MEEPITLTTDRLIIVVVALSFLGGLIWALIWSIKAQAKVEVKAERLFEEKLIPMAESAKTLEEVNSALDTLLLECLNIKSIEEFHKSKGAYINLPEAYREKFKRLRGYLEGKRSILIQK